MIYTVLFVFLYLFIIPFPFSVYLSYYNFYKNFFFEFKFASVFSLKKGFAAIERNNIVLKFSNGKEGRINVSALLSPTADIDIFKSVNITKIDVENLLTRTENSLQFDFILAERTIVSIAAPILATVYPLIRLSYREGFFNKQTKARQSVKINFCVNVISIVKMIIKNMFRRFINE